MCISRSEDVAPADRGGGRRPLPQHEERPRQPPGLGGSSTPPPTPTPLSMPRIGPSSSAEVVIALPTDAAQGSIRGCEEVVAKQGLCRLDTEVDHSD